MRDIIIGFATLIFCLLALFQLAKFNHFKPDFNIEIWIASFSLLFFIIGIFLSRKLFTRPPRIIEKQVIIDNSIPFATDENELKKTGISKREFEILCLINDGLSNQQIADKIFVSENTVKKHITNLFLKLDAERRTEALKKAKQLKIIA